MSTVSKIHQQKIKRQSSAIQIAYERQTRLKQDHSSNRSWSQVVQNQVEQHAPNSTEMSVDNQEDKTSATEAVEDVSPRSSVSIEEASAAASATAGAALIKLFSETMTRNCQRDDINDALTRCWSINPALTLQIVLYSRDVRNGKGEKLVSLYAWMWLRKNKPLTYIQNLLGFLQVGCFKDLLKLAAYAQEEQLPYLDSTGKNWIELELFAEFLKEDWQKFLSWQQKSHGDVNNDIVLVKTNNNNNTNNSNPLNDQEFVMVDDTSPAKPIEEIKTEISPPSSSRNATANAVVEVCFLVDCTGSMSSWIAAVKEHISDIVDSVQSDVQRYASQTSTASASFSSATDSTAPNEQQARAAASAAVRLAFVGYRDYCDTGQRFVKLDFTSNVQEFKQFVSTVRADGGGDSPEDVFGGLHLACEKISWTLSSEEESTAKLIILIADAPCHGVEFHNGLRCLDSRESIEFQEDPFRGKERELVQKVVEKNIAMSFVRIQSDTDRMLEKLQSFYDDRKLGRTLKVLPLGGRTDRFVQEISKTIRETVCPSVVETPSEVIAMKSLHISSLRPCSLSLAAKWAPSEKKQYNKAPYFFVTQLTQLLSFKPPQYRKMLSELRKHLNVVERQACQNEWDEISFASVPARAHKLLKSAFERHQPTRYAEYLANVQAGRATIKTCGIQPHELCQYYLDAALANADASATVEQQWQSMFTKLKSEIAQQPDWKVEDTLVVVDVSGSMTYALLDATKRPLGQASAAASPRPIDVAIAMGLMLSELSVGDYHCKLLLFAEQVEEISVSTTDSLRVKVRKIYETLNNGRGGATDVECVLQYLKQSCSCTSSLNDISSASVQRKLPQRVVIFSDMQFNDCNNADVYSRIPEIFSKATMPEFVFWNVNGEERRGKSNDVSADALYGGCNIKNVSGYTLDVFKMVLANRSQDSLNMIVKTVERYDVTVDPSEI